MTMPGRTFNPNNEYRYGFQGMERDNDFKGNGNSYTTLYRQYDPRLGRWMSLDPLMHKFPGMAPYVAFNNNPIYFTDPLGLQGGPPKGNNTSNSPGTYESTATGGSYTYSSGSTGSSGNSTPSDAQQYKANESLPNFNPGGYGAPPPGYHFEYDDEGYAYDVPNDLAPTSKIDYLEGGQSEGGQGDGDAYDNYRAKNHDGYNDDNIPGSAFAPNIGKILGTKLPWFSQWLLDMKEMTIDVPEQATDGAVAVFEAVIEVKRKVSNNEPPAPGLSTADVVKIDLYVTTTTIHNQYSAFGRNSMVITVPIDSLGEDSTFTPLELRSIDSLKNSGSFNLININTK